MKRPLIAGIAAGAVALGAGVIAVHPMSPSLPDVQVPAIQLSNSQGLDATTAWLDLFSQTSAGNSDASGASLPDQGDASMVVIEPQAQDFDKILDDVVGNVGSQLNTVTAPGSGPDSVTYLIQNSGS